MGVGVKHAHDSDHAAKNRGHSTFSGISRKLQKIIKRYFAHIKTRALCPIHTADADATKLFCRVGVGVGGVYWALETHGATRSSAFDFLNAVGGRVV